MLKKSRHGLTRCPACGVHVRAAATPVLTDCAFCGANLAARVIRRPLTGRGAIVAAGLFSLAACGNSETEPLSPDPDDTVHSDQNDRIEPPDPDDHSMFDPVVPDDNSAVAEYGIAPDDMPAPEYGAPPVEMEMRVEPPDNNVVAPAYGIPAPPPEPPEG